VAPHCTTPTNGQLLIGNGTNFTLATLTAGSGISITNAAGAISIINIGSGSITSVTASSPLASSGERLLILRYLIKAQIKY